MQQSQHQERKAYVNFAALKQLVSIDQVLELADWKPVAIWGSEKRGPCFIHGSSKPTSRSLSVNSEKNAYQCFAPSCGSKGNQLDLAAAYFQLPLREAALKLCEELGIEPPTKGN